PSLEMPLATLELLNNSRMIKIPFTSTREKAIEYLLTLLTKRYPKFVKPVTSFKFEINGSNKKLNITETVEYTVLLNDETYAGFITARDKMSIERLFEILRKYRFFNLSKLIKITENKTELTRIIKNEVGKTIFTFKNYSIDKNKIEWAEDFCFHADNYESVKKSLNLEILNGIISAHAEQVKKSLAKFGILNAEFNDYRDSKLSYIFNILLDDLSIRIGEKDLVEVKNLQSLVTCLCKVDKLLNPVIIVNDDIIKYIKENKFCTEADLINSIMDLTGDVIKKWAVPENLIPGRIIYHRQGNDENYYIDGNAFYDMITAYNQLILFQPEKMSEMSAAEKRKTLQTMEILCEAALNIFKDESLTEILNINNDKAETLKQIVSEYQKVKDRGDAREKQRGRAAAPSRERSVFGILSGIIKSILSLFSRKARGSNNDMKLEEGAVRELSRETKSLYQKIDNLKTPIIPLSDFIELTSENNSRINKIIGELQDNNLKIVVPIYDARKTLYPKRSQKLLIPDMEYLLVSPELIKSADEIRSFTDTMVGYKLKEDIISSKALMAVEKYLLTIHRQKKRPARNR
ncbi:MAG: hypothetical protein MUC95_05100, partial [Spirochaetes bacterium]|nr:hypothetical protein [Spirochaetota bacterium]